MPANRIHVRGLNFNVLDEGSGRAVLLLHGFPDSSSLWRHQIPVLLAAGFRVIVPDLRGFGESDKPTETEAYALPIIVEDIIGLLDTLNLERPDVVSHDWGAVVGWALAALHPNRVDRFVALSNGHSDYFKAGINQLEKFWYILLFQFRGIAEELLTRNNWSLFRDWSRHHPETDAWIKDLSRPGALTAALNWYRANVPPETWEPERWVLPTVSAPTLGVWSSGDPYLTETQMLLSSQHVSGGWRYERVEGASHWMQLDRPKYVSDLIINFLARSADPPLESCFRGLTG
jgi:pimeloyl-ACP methyl ester carboxylesterase